jgi:hypothetical protein
MFQSPLYPFVSYLTILAVPYDDHEILLPTYVALFLTIIVFCLSVVIYLYIVCTGTSFFASMFICRKYTGDVLAFRVTLQTGIPNEVGKDVI